METSVQEALKIGLVNNQIHTLVISGRKFTITRDYRF